MFEVWIEPRGELWSRHNDRDEAERNAAALIDSHECSQPADEPCGIGRIDMWQAFGDRAARRVWTRNGPVRS